MMGTHTRKKWLLSVFVVAVLAAAVTLAGSGIAKLRHTLGLMQTHNDLKWIGMALHQYHEEHGYFPPAVVYDNLGVPIHSWRSLIERYMDTGADAGDDSFSYDLKEPWNSPANLAVAARDRFNNHPYQFLAVIGPHAAWVRHGSRQMSDFTDGSSNTLLLIGIRDSGIGWREPRDVVYNGTTLTIGEKPLQASRDVFVLLADGSVRYGGTGIPQDVLASMITIDAGDNVRVW